MIRSGRSSRRAGLTLVAAALALAVAGCAGGGGHPPGKNGGTASSSSSNGKVRATVYWDLRKSHSVKQVKWQGPSSFELDGGVQARVDLPGATFQDRVDRFGASRDGDQVDDIVMFYPGVKVGEAYTHARQLAKKWNLDTTQLDAWYANQKAHPSRPPDIPSVLANAIGFKPTGPGGPVTSVEIHYSFDDANPCMVSIEFFWR